jgi:predicted DNA-binding WGR domain protein
MVIEYSHHRLVHQSGTKEYNCHLFVNTTTKQTLLVFAWGKTGKAFSVTSSIGLQAAMVHMRAKKLSEKEGRGYDQVTAEREMLGDYAAVTDKLKGLGILHKITKPMIDTFRDGHIDPDVDHLLETEEPEVGPNKTMGEWVEGVAKKRKKPEEPESKPGYADDPLWGIF